MARAAITSASGAAAGSSGDAVSARPTSRSRASSRAREALVEDGLALGVEDRAGVVVERRRAVEIVLADRGFDRAGIEIREAAAGPGVGLGRLPAAPFTLVAQFGHRRPA